MASQLDILALEPFFGGVRRSMLETMIRCSRHRWTLLKLPPRRIERRLSAAAHWFAEQLSRHWVGRLDLLFTSEAMNLADLFHLTPHLRRKPSVVYFHDNQLPDPDGPDQRKAHDLVNLSTGTAASELWFNSMYHLRTFVHRASAMVEKHPELSSRNPLPELMGKMHLMPPPLDLQLSHHIQQSDKPVKRASRVIFVETRDADIRLLNHGLGTLRRRGEKFELITVGPVEELSADFPRTTVPEADDVGQVSGMLRADIFLSARRDSTCDYHAIRAMAAGCIPVLPDAAAYQELIPESLQHRFLYDLNPDNMASRIQDAWHLEAPEGTTAAIQATLKPFNAITACKAMDERIQELVVAQSVR